MKSIRIAVVYLLAGLLAGLALSAMWSEDTQDIGARNNAPEAAVEQRLATLERRIDAVLADNARLLAALEDADRSFGAAAATPENAATAQTAELANAGEEIGMQDAAEAAAVVAATERAGPLRRLRDADRSVVDQLTAAGFSVSDAQVILNGVRVGYVSEIALLIDEERYETLTRVTLEILPDGMVVFPLIGELALGGLTLAEQIRSGLEAQRLRRTDTSESNS